jgi:hypothetical protein
LLALVRRTTFTDVGAGVLRTSLLLAEQVVVKDAIADWFSDEQYINSHAMGSAPGWREPGSGPNIAETRRFLIHVVPALRAARPLIEAGIVVPYPLEQVFTARRREIDATHASLTDALLGDPLALAARFAPSDLAREDTLRGAFVFVGGSWEKQTHDAFGKALFYFAREYVAAHSLGATYCAPFSFERFVCADGLRECVTQGQRVHSCILRSQVPVFGGLTPQRLARLHQHDYFAQVRSDLHRIYGEAPIDASDEVLTAYIEEQERVHLRPILERVQREIDRGVLQRLGVALTSNVFQVAAGVGVGLAMGSVWPPLIASAATVADEVRGGRSKEPSAVAWTALAGHDRSVARELRRVTVQPAGRQPLPDNSLATSRHPWDIPAEPSMSVSVTSGLIRAAWLPGRERQAAVDAAASGYNEGVYRPCPCGSGLKYRFCCKAVGA